MSLGSTLSFASVRSKVETVPSRGRTLRLGKRHVKLARLIADGLHYKRIAFEMGISADTLRLYVCQLYRLTGLSGHVEIAKWVNGNSAHDVVRTLKAWGVAA